MIADLKVRVLLAQVENGNVRRVDPPEREVLNCAARDVLDDLHELVLLDVVEGLADSAVLLVALLLVVFRIEVA